MAKKELELEATISPARELTKEDWKQWGMNLLKFTAPILATFFALLAQGVPVNKALPVAVLGLYGALSDLLTKYSTTTIRVQQ